MDETQKITKISNAPVFEENPFIEKAIEQIEENTSTKKRFLRGSKGVESMSIVDSGGTVRGFQAFMQFVEVDEDKFAKLYISQFAAFWELDKAAIRVFGYILNNLVPNKDIVYVDIDEALKYTGYNAKKTIFAGLATLVSLGVIARSTNHMKYFINPLMFFNGDRVTFAKTYIKKRKGKIEDKNQLSISFSEASSSFDKGK